MSIQQKLTLLLITSVQLLQINSAAIEYVHFLIFRGDINHICPWGELTRGDCSVF